MSERKLVSQKGHENCLWKATGSRFCSVGLSKALTTNKIYIPGKLSQIPLYNIHEKNNGKCRDCVHLAYYCMSSASLCLARRGASQISVELKCIGILLRKQVALVVESDFGDIGKFLIFLNYFLKKVSDVPGVVISEAFSLGHCQGTWEFG